MLTYTKTYPITITIDGEPVRARIRRMTDGEFKDFNLAWYAQVRRLSMPIDRRPGEDALTDAQVIAKREAELTADELARQRTRERFDAEEAAVFTRTAIEAFVTFEPGQVQDEDEKGEPIDVTTGAQILRCFATRSDVLSTLVSQVVLQNTLTLEQKKRLALPSDSARFLSASMTTTNGDTPAPTADGAEPRASAPSAPVTDTASGSSGSTNDATSSGTTVP